MIEVKDIVNDVKTSREHIRVFIESHPESRLYIHETQNYFSVKMPFTDLDGIKYLEVITARLDKHAYFIRSIINTISSKRLETYYKADPYIVFVLGYENFLGALGENPCEEFCSRDTYHICQRVAEDFANSKENADLSISQYEALEVFLARIDKARYL